MHVNPTVFQDREFKKKPAQGFLVTPFKLQGCKVSRKQLQANLKLMCANYPGRTVTIIPGDHNFTGTIMNRIWQHINESSFVIAVCVGANPNVYYEIGMAHTLGKPVLVLGRAGKHIKEDIRFDITGNQFAPIKSFRDVNEITGKVYAFLDEIFRR